MLSVHRYWNIPATPRTALCPCTPPTTYTGFFHHRYQRLQVQWSIESASEQADVHTKGLVSWHPVFLVWLRPLGHFLMGWLSDFRKVRLTSLGISLRIYKMTSLKRISPVCISVNVSQHLSALSSSVLAFCSFPDACIFLGDKPNFTSDDLPSEKARSLMTLFNLVKVMVQLIRYLLSIFRSWWWCHHTLWSRSCKDAADLDSCIYPCSPGASTLVWKWSLPDENLFPLPGLGEISLQAKRNSHVAQSTGSLCF